MGESPPCPRGSCTETNLAQTAFGVGCVAPPFVPWGGTRLWDDPSVPVSGRPCPEVTENPKAPWGGRCSSSWLVPSGNTSTTRPTARSWPGAPISSTLSERCGPEPPFLWGQGRWVTGGCREGAGHQAMQPLAALSHHSSPERPCQALQGCAKGSSYLSAVGWGRR